MRDAKDPLDDCLFRNATFVKLPEPPKRGKAGNSNSEFVQAGTGHAAGRFGRRRRRMTLLFRTGSGRSY